MRVDGGSATTSLTAARAMTIWTAAAASTPLTIRRRGRRHGQPAAHNDQDTGGAGIDPLVGNRQRHLTGGAFNDTLVGGAGANAPMSGPAGVTVSTAAAARPDLRRRGNDVCRH